MIYLYVDHTVIWLHAIAMHLITMDLVNSVGLNLIFYFFYVTYQIHATCLDFTLLSAFSPFWVYNDMTARRW